LSNGMFINTAVTCENTHSSATAKNCKVIKCEVLCDIINVPAAMIIRISHAEN